MQTGKGLVLRQAGLTPSEFMRSTFTGDPHGTAEVPCDGCRECCWHHRVGVDPAAERPQDLAHLTMEHDADGYFLSKRADGACVHLGPQGCTVYSHRPRGCRTYDCRVAGLAGLVEPFEGDHRAPAWHFPVRTPEDKAVLLAAGLAAYPYVKRQLSGETLPSWAEMLVTVLKHVHELMEEFYAIPEDRRAQAITEIAAKLQGRDDG